MIGTLVQCQHLLGPDSGKCICRVTEENKRDYVNLVARHRMTTAIKPQINSFLEGFWDLVPKVGAVF